MKITLDKIQLDELLKIALDGLTPLVRFNCDYDIMLAESQQKGALALCHVRNGLQKMLEENPIEPPALPRTPFPLELKICPFCGGSPQYYESDDGFGHLTCPFCHISTHRIGPATQETLEWPQKRWNSRV